MSTQDVGTVGMKYTRTNSNIPFFGSPEDSEQGRKDTWQAIIDFHKNVIGLGNRVYVTYNGNEMNFICQDITKDELKTLVLAHGDINGDFYHNVTLEYTYHLQNNITMEAWMDDRILQIPNFEEEMDALHVHIFDRYNSIEY